MGFNIQGHKSERRCGITLASGEDFEDFADKWLDLGVSVNVVGTVGTGDTVGAILFEAIAMRGRSSLHRDELLRVLNRVAGAAAITC